jgi:hypothetical protein
MAMVLAVYRTELEAAQLRVAAAGLLHDRLSVGAPAAAWSNMDVLSMIAQHVCATPLRFENFSGIFGHRFLPIGKFATMSRAVPTSAYLVEDDGALLTDNMLGCTHGDWVALSRADSPMCGSDKCYAEFEIVAGDAVIGVGVARCPSSWYFWGVDSASGDTSYNDQFLPSWGTFWRPNWTRPSAYGERFEPGDVLGLLLDCTARWSSNQRWYDQCQLVRHAGTSLTLFKNGTRIGVAMGPAGGMFCWAVRFVSPGSSIRIAGKSAPDLSADECAKQADEVVAIETEIAARALNDPSFTYMY